MTQIAFVGNLTSPPEIRWTSSGKAVVNVTVAVNRKKGDKEETDFHRVTVWEGMAENIARLDKGTRVVVIGRLTSREFETKEGEKRVGWDVTADAIGPDLRFAVAEVTKTAQRGTTAPQEPEQPDVWATPATDGFNGYNDDAATPF